MFACLALGLGELARVVTLTVASVEPSRAVALSLLYHAAAWLVAIPGAILFARNRPGRS